MVSHLKFCMRLRRTGIRGYGSRGGRLKTKADSSFLITTTYKRETFDKIKKTHNLNMVKGTRLKERNAASKEFDEVIFLDGNEDESNKIKSKKNKKQTMKDQTKITNYFSPSSVTHALREERKGIPLVNGNCDGFKLKHKSALSSPCKENKLENGYDVENKGQSTICTRSQSQKFSTPDMLIKTPEKVKKEPLMLNGCISPNKEAYTSPERSPQKSPTSPLSGPPTPHKIQALNEEKLRLDSPLSPSSALSKLRILSPSKLKFTQTGSKAKRKLPNQNSITLDSSVGVTISKTKNEKPAKVNGALKTNSKSTMRNTQMTEFFPIRRSHRKPKATIIQEKQKQIEERILSGVEEGLKVQTFEHKGRGVMTTRHFKKGEMVVEYIGNLIDTKEAKDREKKYALDTSKGCYMYYFTFQNNQFCIDATEESGYLGRLVNHSRNGNLVTKTVEVGGKPHLILIAKTDIEAGEEVLYDYGDRSKQAIEHHPWLAL